ncbi:hypothetical protein MMC18_009627 [Xylographa bjoerkii]|nr:hypothetical protein [Xylographa bjoerkii]
MGLLATIKSLSVLFGQRYPYGRLTTTRFEGIAIFGCGNARRSMVAALLPAVFAKFDAKFKAGPNFRHRPEGVILNTPQGLRAIYDHKANVRKGDYYETHARKSGIRNTLSVIDKSKHAFQRKVLSAAFSDKAVCSAETFVVRKVDRWCDIITDSSRDDWGPPKNMSEWAEYLVFDVLGDLTFGRNFKIKEPGANEFRGLHKLLDVISPKDMRRYVSFVSTCLVERGKQEQDREKENSAATGPKDMFYYLFRAKDPETGKTGYSEAQLFSEANNLIIAGSDTTSTVFAAMFVYLMRNPIAYEKLAAEIRQTFSSVDDISYTLNPKLASCQYLRAFIDETLRMNPPGGAELPREVLPGGLTLHGGRVLGEGTKVGTAMYALHHNEFYFPEPFFFSPERWILDEKAGVTNESLAAARSAFAPFSIGARGCICKTLAYLEMSVPMARVIYQLDIGKVEHDTLGEGAPSLGWGRNRSQFQMKDAFIALRDGPIVQFRRRKVD